MGYRASKTLSTCDTTADGCDTRHKYIISCIVSQRNTSLTWIRVICILPICRVISLVYLLFFLSSSHRRFGVRSAFQKCPKHLVRSASEFPQRHIWTPPHFHTPPDSYSSPPFCVITITCFGRVFTNTRLDHVSRSHFDMREPTRRVWRLSENSRTQK